MTTSSSMESSTSLLEKYANLHSDMEQARSEAAQCRSEMQTCHAHIQDLLEQRRSLQEATDQANEEQEQLAAQLEQQGRALETLQHDHDQVLKRKHDHAHHVQSMIQRRQETTRNDYEQSLQKFDSACQQVLQGKVLLLQPPVPPREALAAIGTTTSVLGTGHSIQNSNAQLDPLDHDQENHGNSSSSLSPNTTNIMKMDWKILFGQVLSTTNEEELCNVIQELYPDLVEPTTNDRDDQGPPPTPTTLDHSPQKQETTVLLSLPIEKNDKVDEDESKEANVQTSNKKQAASTQSSQQQQQLFTQCVQIIDKLLLLKTHTADEAHERLVEMQDQYHQAMQEYDLVHKDHAQCQTKMTRQQSQKEQLKRQLERLQKDVKRLHQQLDQVHSQTLELQQQRQELQTGPKRPKPRHDHDSSRTALQVRNPYLHSAKTKPTKRPFQESVESLMATKGDGMPPNHSSSAKKSESSSVKRKTKHGSSSSLRATISPLPETNSTHSTLTTTPMIAMDHAYDRIQDSSTLHPHRVGRVRGARDFGVSLSLESTAAMVSSHHDDNDCTENFHGSNNEAETEKFTNRRYPDKVVPALSPIPLSSDRRTRILESTANTTATTAIGQAPVVVSAAKGAGDSSSKRLVRRRLHHSSSPDSLLSQDKSFAGNDEDDDDDDDTHDDHDPVFHFVFRK